jgi:serine/threonine protein phosphatase 1
LSRLIAIGDIHGTYNKLVELWDNLKVKADDRVIFLGDYVDRGPDSAGVIEFVASLRSENPNVTLLLGNHEDMMIEGFKSVYDYNWDSQGGYETMQSLNKKGLSLYSAVEFAYSLQLTEIVKTNLQTYYFSHAGWNPKQSLQSQAQNPDRDIVTWERSHVNKAFGGWSDGCAVFGHTPMDRPFIAKGRIGIDTGAVFGGPLTAVILPQNQGEVPCFVQV